MHFVHPISCYFSVQNILLNTLFPNTISQDRIQGERTGAVAPGLHKTGMQSTDFIETFASLKSRKVSLHF
jgi:hypothetical protein